MLLLAAATPDIGALRRVLAQCPASAALAVDADDRDWAPATSLLPEHREVWQTAGEPLPMAPITIHLFAGGGHLIVEQHSVVATRQADGVWQLHARGRSSGVSTDEPWHLLPPIDRSLSLEAGTRLDAILESPCFWAEPTQLSGLTSDGPPPLGIFVVTVEAQTPGMQRAAALIGAVGGLTGEVERLLLP